MSNVKLLSNSAKRKSSNLEFRVRCIRRNSVDIHIVRRTTPSRLEMSKYQYQYRTVRIELDQAKPSQAKSSRVTYHVSHITSLEPCCLVDIRTHELEAVSSGVSRRVSSRVSRHRLYSRRSTHSLVVVAYGGCTVGLP
jgi:hypothetical protein